MAKRKNGEGSWGITFKNGHKYHRFRINGKDYYGHTQRECREKYENDRKNGFVLTPRTTFQEYLLEWLELKKGQVEPTTYTGYIDCIKGMLINQKSGYNLADIQMHNLTSQKINSYYEYLAETYAPASIKKLHDLIKECLTRAVDDCVIKREVIRDVYIPRETNIKKKTKKVAALSERDLLLFIHEANRKYNNGEPVYGINAKLLIFLSATGLRISEAIALKWKNVSKNHEYIYIEESAYEIKENGIRIKGDKEPKSKSSKRRVPLSLSSSAIEILQYCAEKYPQKKSNDYVFLTRTGQKIDRHNVYKTFRKIIEHVEFQDLKEGTTVDIHSLRHTYGSIILKKGKVDGKSITAKEIKSISLLLGHSDIRTTMNVYTDLIDEDLKDVVEIIDY